MKISQAPLFFQFLTQYIKDEQVDNFENYDFLGEDELEIENICQCSDQLCSTVYLKRNKDWDNLEITWIGGYDDRGMVIFHFLPNGRLEIEALEAVYPYKQELITLFNKVSKHQ